MCALTETRLTGIDKMKLDSGVIVRGTSGWQVQGRRGRGRPKETWMCTMRREAGEECWEDLEELAQDR